MDDGSVRPRQDMDSDLDLRSLTRSLNGEIRAVI